MQRFIRDALLIVCGTHSHSRRARVTTTHPTQAMGRGGRKEASGRRQYSALLQVGAFRAIRSFSKAFFA
jgi:hypothetical protein